VNGIEVTAIVRFLGFRQYDTCEECENHLYEVLLIIVQFVRPVIGVETQINFLDLGQQMKIKTRIRSKTFEPRDVNRGEELIVERSYRPERGDMFFIHFPHPMISNRK
jgi:hypothetical protein